MQGKLRRKLVKQAADKLGQARAKAKKALKKQRISIPCRTALTQGIKAARNALEGLRTP